MPKSQLVNAEQVLLGMGYGTRPRAAASFSSAHFHHLERLVRDDAEVVELHHAIELPISPFRIDVPALWDAARQVQVGGATAGVLSDEHLVIHLCIHLAWHHAFGRAGLKALLDVGPHASRPPEGLLQRAHYLALGLVPPLAQLRRGYGRPTVESALRLYPRRFRDLVQRRGTMIMRAARERDTAWAVVQHLMDRGRIAHWIARYS